MNGRIIDNETDLQYIVYIYAIEIIENNSYFIANYDIDYDVDINCF